MAKIKICGLTRPEDITSVNRVLPEYAGFVFAPGRRRVTPEQVKQLSGKLHPAICRVGVFVNETPECVADIAAVCGLKVVQLHGDEPQEYLKELKNRLPAETIIWKALRIRDKASLQMLDRYPEADAFLLDTYEEGVYGGSGKSFNWELAVEAAKSCRIILAGGITPENVQKAIYGVRPYAVDTSSGVEIAGVKDESRIRAFVCAARSYDG